MEKILVINPGSTSTKIAVFNGGNMEWVESISHSAAELAKYGEIYDQLDMRRGLILGVLESHGTKVSDLTAVAARGGLLCAVEAGAYAINQEMLDLLRYRPRDQHASNLAAPLAYSIAQSIGVPSYIYDGVTVDEMIPVARITGLKEINRRGQGHNLNMRAAAIRWCNEHGYDLADKNLVVAHLGGGISISVISGGRIIDMTSDADGPFAPERAGGLPVDQIVDLIFKGGYDQRSIMKKMKRSGGLVSHFGTSDSREVEKLIDAGDKQAELVYSAMALNVSKQIAAMSVTACGRIDQIILTGGVAYSKRFTGWIEERVAFIAPVSVIAGENEMKSLAEGILRVLEGREKAHEFSEKG